MCETFFSVGLTGKSLGLHGLNKPLPSLNHLLPSYSPFPMLISCIPIYLMAQSHALCASV